MSTSLKLFYFAAVKVLFNIFNPQTMDVVIV